MSAPLMVQTVNVKGSVEPSQEGRCTCLTAGLLSGLSDCVPTFQWGWYWLRTAGQAGTGRSSERRNASGQRTSSAIERLMVVKPAGRRKNLPVLTGGVSIDVF